MGCANSKLDDLPAVSLCRNRLTFLDDAIHHRYLLAESHRAYLHSLKQVGHFLHNFVTDHAAASSDRGGPSSPKLNLPPAKKAEASGADSGAKAAHHSHSNSGGHIEFRSDLDDDDESGSQSGSDHSSPLHDHHREFEPSGGLYVQNPDGNYMQMMMGGADGEMFGGYNTYTNTNTHVNYMKNEPKSSIVYQQKPVSPETVQYHHLMGESSSSADSYPYSYAHTYPANSDSSSSSNPYSYPHSYPADSDSSSIPYSYFRYPNPTNPPQQPGGGGGYYGLPYGEVGSSSKPPPPPPSPPQASPWEFLNFFESYGDKYYPTYTPNRDSKELREEEGIPDLEDEEFGHHEPVKKVHVAKKFLDAGDGGGAGDEGSISSVDSGGDAEESLYQPRPSMDDHEEGVAYEVHVVEKKVVDGERGEEQRNAGRPNSRDPADVAREIEFHFVRAAETGGEIVQILEVGKLPYGRKHVASKMLHVVTPALSVVSSQPSSSKSAESSSSNEKAGPGTVDIDEDLALRTKKLSSTLHKLHLWEKKLYNEVKAEEKMRVVHDRKVRKLKRMDERGAEAHKVDATRTIIRSLSTKIRMAIQVVDKISVMISKIRDEELWPQINELIQGLTKMWKNMLECHRNQCLAIREAKSFGPIGSGKMHDDSHLEATSQLEQELLNWTYRFSSWIGAQKGYVRALNSWLLKCLPDEREETVDGVVPFSPGRIGAPPIFVICNQWSQAMERISEKEVIDSMHVLAMGVFQLWEQDKLEMRHKMVAHKDMERHVRKLDREDQKMQKQIQALDKKMVLASGNGNDHLVSGRAVYQSDTSISNLQGSLQHIFEALERFTADSVKAYEELLQRTKEVMQPRESEGIP